MKLKDITFLPVGLYLYNGNYENILEHPSIKDSKIITLQFTKKQLFDETIKSAIRSDPDVIIFYNSYIEEEFIQMAVNSGHLVILLNCNHHIFSFNDIDNQYIHDLNKIIIGEKICNF